jgi:pimeloyl-ACP methyl ester carboxylesterase
MARLISRTLIVEGRPARVWRGGSGPTLLLVHGGLGDAQLHWEAVWEGLADSFTVAAPDLPGFGGTAPLPVASFGAFAEWLDSLMETLGFPRAVIVGNSFGGGVARLYAAAHPRRVVRLILVNGGRLPRVPSIVLKLMSIPRLSNWMFERMRRQSFSRAGLKRLIGNERLLTPEFLARTQAASAGFVAAMRQAAFAALPIEQTPGCPTLVLWGEWDRRAPLSKGRALAKEIPGAKFQPIPGAGHLPQLEQPTWFLSLVRDFAQKRS